MNVLAGLQFNNRQPSGTRYGEEVQNAVFASRVRKHLCIDESLVEHGIHTRYVFANNGFQPALRLSAVERMARIAGQRVALNLQFMQKVLESRTRGVGKFFAGVGNSKKNAAVIPTREGQAAKMQPHFA